MNKARYIVHSKFQHLHINSYIQMRSLFRFRFKPAIFTARQNNNRGELSLRLRSNLANIFYKRKQNPQIAILWSTVWLMRFQKSCLIWNIIQICRHTQVIQCVTSITHHIKMHSLLLEIFKPTYTALRCLILNSSKFWWIFSEAIKYEILFFMYIYMFIYFYRLQISFNSLQNLSIPTKIHTTCHKYIHT